MRNLPTITKYLLGINCIVWILDSLLRGSGIYMPGLTGLYPYWSDNFHIWQPLTYMFMHQGFSHLFCNMFAVLMFGPVLENEWGPKRYLTYYLVCGLGAAFVQELVWHTFGAHPLSCTIGASGAVFGILMAFGWLFPTVEMYLLFIPIPIKARTFVIGYAVIELLAGIGNLAGDNVAHFAHLGGMLFGLILLLWWKHNITGKIGDFFHHTTGSHPTQLDSSKERDFSGYHYQKRV